MTLLEDVQALRRACNEITTQIRALQAASDRQEEQINGQRGLSATLNELALEIKGLRRAAYWVAGVIVTGSITFAFGVLRLAGHL
jgi:Cu/Ag efflux pump CusA